MIDMCDCKIFEQGARDNLDPGKCQSIVADFVCLMCLSEKKRFSHHHGDDGGYRGDTLECSECHSYIRYFYDYALREHYKDEFYYGKYCIVPSIDKIVLVKNYNKLDCEEIFLPKFEFKDKEQFWNKVKMCLIFQ